MSRAAAILALFSLAAAGGCDVSSQVGSRWLATADVTAASGGALAIAAAQSASLAGAALDLPPHALAQDTTVGVSPGASLAGGDWLAAGPAVEWDPSDAILFDSANFALPAQVPAGRSPGDLLVLTDDPGELLPGAFDPNLGLVHFQASHLGDFQAVVGRPCSGLDGCAEGNSCVHGFCRPGDGPHDEPGSR